MDGFVRPEVMMLQKVLDGFHDEKFHELTSVVSLISLAPTIILNFAHHDRVWSRTPTKKFVQRNEPNISFKELMDFCDSESIVIQDLEFAQHFYSHPLIKENPTVRFYAGFPMMLADGQIIGMLHVMDEKPRTFTWAQVQAITVLLRIVAENIEKDVQAEMQKKTADEAFDKQKEFLDAVLENLNDGVVACNDIGELTISNRATREFHALDANHEVSQSGLPEDYTLFHSDGKTPIQFSDFPLVKALVDGQVKDFEMVLESRNGLRRNLLCNGRAMFNKEGQKLGAVVATRDMTAIKNANLKVDASTKMLRTLIDVCPVGIAVFDLDEKIMMWNPANEKIFGCGIEDVLNKDMPCEDENHIRQVSEIIQIVRRTKNKIENYKARYRKQGQQIDVQLSVIPLLDEHNELYSFMAVFIDVSEVKQREANLLESNRALKAASVAKSEFLANMSHEIRTPLNGVIGMTDLVMMSDLNEEQRQHLQIVHTSANNLLSIISDILDFSKIEAGKLDVEKVNFDLEQVVSEVYETLQLVAENKSLKLVKNFISGPTEPVFMGDPGRIRQVLLNLVNNAIKFSEYGEIQTIVKFEKIEKNKTILRFEVKDCGLGISEDVLNKLFHPFAQADSSTTRRFGGTGLGLSISKGLVDLMGGNIGVESEVGSGSTFWFALQLEDFIPVKVSVPKSNVRAKDLKNSDQQKPLRILMAEDNMMNQTIALAMLSKLGYTADVVKHGKAAVEALRQQEYDLILMDCQMPEMDGFQATQIIRSDSELPNHIGIIALTANAMKGDREKCIECGMDDYVAKPLRVDMLKEVLERFLAKNAA